MGRTISTARRLAVAFALLAAPVVASSAELLPTDPSSAPTTAPRYVEGEVVVKFRPGARAVAGLESDARILAVEPLDDTGIDRLRLTGMTTREAVAWLRSRPDVTYAEPNYLLSIAALPDDSLFADQWSLRNTGQGGGIPGADIDAATAWDRATGSPDVLVGVIDSGIDFAHPDLAAHVYTNPGEIPGNGVDDDANGRVDDVHGWDFIDDDADAHDDYGHGTHVAGIIGAIGDNRIGIAGVCWRVTLLPIRIINAQGVGDLAAAVRAVRYATRMGVRLTSNSWGRMPRSQAMADVIQEALEHGVLFVAAAGNGGLDDDVIDHYPSADEHENVIAVAATDARDELARFSNYGAVSVDLAAPGENIVSTFNVGGYRPLTGTSQATPHVAGALALAFSRAPHIAPLALRELLFATARRLPSLAGRMASGGRLDVGRLIAALDVEPPATVTDLAVGTVAGTQAALRWTAPADDGTTAVSRYDIRRAPFAIDSMTFDAAEPVALGIVPRAPGQPEQVELTGLSFETTFWVAMRAVDEHGNRSALSNTVTFTTLPPPIARLSTEPLEIAVAAGGAESRTVTIENVGASELHVSLSVRADLAGAVATVPPLPVAAATRLRLAILTSGGDATALHSLLSARPELERVDVIRLDRETVTAQRLSDYHAVLLAPATRISDRVSTGNLLADYADTGGGVILDQASFVSGLSISGRIATGSALPFAPAATGLQGAILAPVDATHPLALAVRQLFTFPMIPVTPLPDAHVVAWWEAGFPVVAYRQVNVVGINIPLGANAWGGDVADLVVNATRWSARAPSWLAVEPATAVVPPGGRVDVAVTATAGPWVGVERLAVVRVATDDPAAALTELPARMSVAGVARLAVEGAQRDFVATGPLPSPVTITHRFATGTAGGTGGYVQYRASGTFSPTQPSNRVVLDGDRIGSLVGPPSQCLTLERTFSIGDAALAGYLADGTVRADVFPPSAPPSCPGTYHVRFGYFGRADTLDFGTAYLMHPVTLSVVARNVGTAPLRLRGVATEPAAFAASLPDMLLAPGLAATIRIVFSAATLGTYAGTLRVLGDDGVGNATVALRGTVAGRPILAVDPDRLDASAVTGESSAAAIEVGNDGDSPLTFQVVTRATIAAGAGAAAVPWLSVTPASGTLAPGQNVRLDATMDSNGLPLGVNAAEIVVDSNDPVTPQHVVPVTLTVTGRARAVLGGVPIVIESREPVAPPASMTFHRLRLSQPPAVGGIVNVVAGGDHVAAYASVDVAGTLRALAGGDQIACLPLSGGFAVDAAALSAAAASGSFDVSVSSQLRAVACPTGENVVRLRYSPLRDTLDFGAIADGGSGRATLLVFNVGNGTLRVRVANADREGLQFDAESLIVAPGGSGALSVRLASTAVASATSLELRVYEPHERTLRVPFRASIVSAPVARVETTAGPIEVAPGDSASRSLRLRNAGAGALSYSARVVWPSLRWSSRAPIAVPATPSLSFWARPLAREPVRCLIADAGSGSLYVLGNDSLWSRFDPESRVWDRRADPPALLPQAQGAWLGGRAYVVAMDADPLVLAVYDEATDQWNTMAVPGLHAGAAIASDGSRHLYLAEGTRLFRLDPERGERVELASPPVALHAGRMHFAGDALYADALDPGSVWPAFLRFDPAANQWSILPRPPVLSRLASTFDPVRGEWVVAPGNRADLWRYPVAGGGWRRETSALLDPGQGGMAWLPGSPGVCVSRSITPGLAAEGAPPRPLVSLRAPTGSLSAGQEADLGLTVHTDEVPPGVAELQLEIRTDDPASPVIVVPVTVAIATGPHLATGGEWRAATVTSFPYSPLTTSHTFATRATPDGPGRFEVVATSRSSFSPASLQLNADGRAIASILPFPVTCRDGSAAAEVEPDTLASMAADGRIDAQVVDPSFTSSCDTGEWARHYVRLRYPVADLPHDFGSVAVGDARKVSLRLRNLGDAPLTNLRVTAAGSDLTLMTDVEVATLAPGTETHVVATWSPTATGPWTGTIVIESDDPRQPRRTGTLRGVAVTPASAVVDPPAVRAGVRPGGVIERSLVLSNPGEEPLSWRLSVGIGAAASATVAEETEPAPTRATAPRLASESAPATRPTLEIVRDLLTLGHGAITEVVPNRYDFLEGETGLRILDGGDDMYDGGNLLLTDRGPLPYTQGVIVPLASGPPGRYFTLKQPGLFVLAADCVDLPYFATRGSVILEFAEGAAVTTATLTRTRFGATFHGYVRRVFGTPRPSVNHLFIVETPEPVPHSEDLDPATDDQAVFHLPDGARLYYLLFAGRDGAHMDDSVMEIVMDRFLDVVHGTSWALPEPRLGVVPPGEARRIALRLDATELTVGRHTLALTLHSNDRLRPTLAIPVTLQVGEPARATLRVEPRTLNLDSQGRWVTARLDGPPVDAIARGTVRLNGIPPFDSVAEASGSIAGEGSPGDTTLGLKFDRAALIASLSGTPAAELRSGTLVIVGDLVDGGWFEARDTIALVRSHDARAALAAGPVPLALEPAAPNPFRWVTRAAFSLPAAADVTLEVFDLAGRRVRVLHDGPAGAGRHDIAWGGTDARGRRVPAGVYVLRMVAAGAVFQRRVVRLE